jgi:hypothetical protein
VPTYGQTLYAQYHPAARLDEALAIARQEAANEAQYRANVRAELAASRERLQQYRTAGARARTGAGGAGGAGGLDLLVELAKAEPARQRGLTKDVLDAQESVRREYDTPSPVAQPYLLSAVQDVRAASDEAAGRDPMRLAGTAVQSFNAQLARGVRTLEGLSTPQRQLLGLQYMSQLAQLPQFQAQPELLEVVRTDVAANLGVQHLDPEQFRADRVAAVQEAAAALSPGVTGFEQQVRGMALGAAERELAGAGAAAPGAAPREATLEEVALGRYLQALQDAESPGMVTPAELEAMGDEGPAAAEAYQRAQATGQYPAGAALLFDPGYLSELRNQAALEQQAAELPAGLPREEEVQRRALELFGPYARQVPELQGAVPESMRYGPGAELEPGAPPRRLLRQVAPAAYRRLDDFTGEPRTYAEQVAQRVLTASGPAPRGAELDQVVRTIREALPDAEDQQEALTYVMARSLSADRAERTLAPPTAPSVAAPAPAPAAAPSLVPGGVTRLGGGQVDTSPAAMLASAAAPAPMRSLDMGNTELVGSLPAPSPPPAVPSPAAGSAAGAISPRLRVSMSPLLMGLQVGPGRELFEPRDVFMEEYQRQAQQAQAARLRR